MIRLLIVADIRLYREGLAQILAREAGLTVVATAAGEDEAIRSARDLALDVALIDMAMARSLDSVRSMLQVAPALRLVALAVSEIDHEVISCAEAGIAGYVPRGASVQELVTVLEGVARGELVCSPRVAAALLKRVTSLAGRDAPAALAALTVRERQIAELLEAGLSNKEIAARLGIGVSTVKNHVHNLLEKLRVHRRGQAVARLWGSRQAPRFTARDLPPGHRATPVS